MIFAGADPQGLIVANYLRIDPVEMHRIVETDLGSLDLANEVFMSDRGGTPNLGACTLTLRR